jgi:hypothetical protein
MLFHLASNATMTASAVVVFGWIWVITWSPALFVGTFNGFPPQAPKLFVAPTGVALQF